MAIQGSCHCGDVSFEIEGQIPDKLVRCTCSFCAKRGGLHAYYAPEQFKLVTPVSKTSTYRWQTHLVAHNFCPKCGIAVYSDSPKFQMDGTWDGTSRVVCVNARLFNDFDAASHPVDVIDGKNLW
jgi:hypothetical protein